MEKTECAEHPVRGPCQLPSGDPDFMEEDGQSAWDSITADGQSDRSQPKAIGHYVGAGHETLSRQLAALDGPKDAASAAAADEAFPNRVSRRLGKLLLPGWRRS